MTDTDPYKILGVSRAASEDEIKKAYRTLSRKYHPDSNINNPNREQAEEKFKQVLQAYNQIMEEKERGYTEDSFDGDYFGSFSYRTEQRRKTYESDATEMHLRAAANYIQNRYYKEALNVLGQMSERSADWYFYAAVANAGIGNQILALEYAKQAAIMEPDNYKYQRLVRQLEAGGSWYQSMQRPYSTQHFGGIFCAEVCAACTICNYCAYCATDSCGLYRLYFEMCC